MLGEIQSQGTPKKEIPRRMGTPTYGKVLRVQREVKKYQAMWGTHCAVLLTQIIHFYLKTC